MSVPREDGQSQFDLGNEHAARGEWEDAEAAYRSADDAGHPTGAAHLGILLEQRGHLRDALDAYRRADRRGDHVGAFRLGLLLSGAGDWEGAQEAFARADERPPPEGFDLVAVLRGRDEAARAAAPAPGGQRPAFANPVLVGAITVLIAVVAVFLSYNANRGLPFVPTQLLRVDIADGSNLVAGNDVREGGFRVGLVSSMKPVELSNGQVGAELQLKLEKSHGRVPVDSTATVLPRSVLGTKYVQLYYGRSSQVFADGGTLPITQTSVPVQFDDIFRTFDTRTRRAIKHDLAGYGDALTARGSSLNDTISSLPQLLGHLEPVARYLSSPGTGLTRFFDSLNGFMGAVAPVAAVNARLFTDMATTFEAVSRDPVALESTIAQSPPTLDVSTDSLRTQQPFLVDLTALGNALTPATAELKAALPDINPAIEAGTSTLSRTPVLNAKLQDVMSALKSLALNPGTNVAINALRATVSTLNPMIRYLGPYVTVCNGWNYWWTFLSEHVSEQTQFGFAQRAMLNGGPTPQRNAVESQGATQPANGGIPQTPLFGPEFFHAPNYRGAIDTHGNADCEAGQTGYPFKLNHGDPLGRSLMTDSHVPGNQGPTFTGRTHVPKGETFSRNPSNGPQLPSNPANP